MSLSLERTENDKDVVQRAVIDALQKLAKDKILVESSTNVVQLDRDLGDSLLLLQFTWDIEEQLGFKLSQDEWFTFFRLPNWKTVPDSRLANEEWERDVVPTLTVAAFTDFVRQRYVPPSFDPVSVLGSPPCPAAGYFVGMSALVQQVQPDAERFGPSTPITQVLPSHSLRIFWRRLSRAAGRSLPELSFWLNHLANVLLVASAACLVFGVFVNWAFFAAAWLLCLKGILFGWWLHRRANPLPRGIVTFGDLSRHLAGQRDIPSPKPFARDIDVWVRRKLLRWPAPESPSDGNND